MKVAIIGCGYSGLSAIRRCAEMNINCVAFELSGQVGGLWVYTEKIGTDEFGIPIQTSLYDSVRTNGPKQTLEFDDFKFKTEEDTCYPRHHEVRRFLNDFASHFNLSKYIKFYHYVTNVSRVGNKWLLQVRNLKAQNDEKYEFDAVMICNGHTTKPFIPKFNGIESFSGLQLHSHDYRRKDIFKNKKVLVIGNAASGIEIACESSTVAEKTFLTYRDDCEIIICCPNLVWKKNVKMINGNNVTFLDDSSENIDIIVYCTGYQYYYPFLDPSCGITVEDDGQIVKPLYKYYININEPTMCFIGLFQRTIISYLFDFQVQAFLKILTNQIELPTYEEMMKWLDKENERKSELGIPRNKYYHLSEDIEEYFDDITSYAKLKNIPPVLFKIFRKNEEVYGENFFKLRQLYFKIIDDENYVWYFKEE